MKILRRIFAPKEVRIVLGVLDEVGFGFDCEAFRILRNRIQDAFLQDYSKVVSAVEEGISPRQQVYFAIANLAGDYLESGEYHLYRGILNPLGPGEDLLRLFDVSLDKLVQSGAIDDGDAKAQKTGIRECIESVG
jgi:hypothetical protein